MRRNMEMNLYKTKIIVFRNGGVLRDNEKWYYRAQRIEVVSSYKYMGLTITPKLIWTRAKENLATQDKKIYYYSI